MSDELLNTLGQVERESRPAEDWDEVLDGRITAAEAVSRGKARGDDADELDALARASAPPSPSARAVWVTRARAALDAKDEDEDDEPKPPAENSPAPSPPIDLAPRRAARTRWLTGGAVVLVATAAALVLWLRARPGPSGPDSTGAPLPSFRMTVRNGTVGQMRNPGPSAEGPALYRPDSGVHWSFQPEEPSRGPLELAAIVRGDDGTACLQRLPVARSSPDGVLEVRGTMAETLGLGPGDWTVVPVVARTGALPADRGECTHPRDLPCPCPNPIEAGASIEPARLQPERGPTAWRQLDEYAMRVQ